jgi:hypothetical protein
MPNFPRGHWAIKTNAHNANLIATLSRQTVNTTPGRITWILTASDTITLRGIPAIGRGVEGAINHTRPDQT